MNHDQRGTPGPGAHKPLLLGALAASAGYHIAQANVAAVANYEHHIGTPLKLRKEEFSLLMLLAANGPLPPKRLAQTLTLSAPNLTLVLDRLQERGLLARERNPSDGRSQYIVLTKAGQALAQEASAAALPMEQELLERLSRAEHAMLIELLGKLAGQRGLG